MCRKIYISRWCSLVNIRFAPIYACINDWKDNATTSAPSTGNLYYHCLTEITAWISNHINYYVGISYSCISVLSSTRSQGNKCIPLFCCVDVITYLCANRDAGLANLGSQKKALRGQIEDWRVKFDVPHLKWCCWNRKFLVLFIALIIYLFFIMFIHLFIDAPITPYIYIYAYIMDAYIYHTCGYISYTLMHFVCTCMRLTDNM